MACFTDLNDDILSIIKSKLKIIDEQEKKKLDNFKYADEGLKNIKEIYKNSKQLTIEIREIIYDRLYKRCVSNEDINEYILTRDLEIYISFYR